MTRKNFTGATLSGATMGPGSLPVGTADALMARMFPTASTFSSDPVGWYQDKLGHFLWSKQREILHAIQNHHLVAVKSAHATGKSFTVSGAGAWWIDQHRFGEAFLVTTAPSWNQVEAILWREIRRRWNEGKLGGRITQDCKWHLGHGGGSRAGASDEEIVGIGRKPADYDEYSFQGIHARFLMGILDEAGGVPESLWTSILSLATNESSRILAIGNPEDPNSHFATICRPGSGWHVITISAFDTPAFTGEKVPQHVLDNLVSKQWVEDRRRDWGEGSPLWVAKVLGQFPDISDEYLITPALIEYCRQNDLPGLDTGRLGADIARMGTDKTVVYHNRGGVIRLAGAWAKKDTMQTSGLIITILSRFGATRIPIVVDIIGLGSGVYDRLKEQKFNVVGHQGSERAYNPVRFRNRRSEVWWTFKTLMEDGLIDLDPGDDILAAQLGTVKWSTDSSGRIVVETKEDLRDRGLPSPDHADAAVMSAIASAPVPRNTAAVQSSTSITGDLMARVM